MIERPRLSRACAALASAALFACGLSAAPASAQGGVEEVTNFGICASLIVAGRDRTGSCEPRLISGHAAGRSAFVFRLGAANRISFAGPDGAAAGDRATIALDMVLVWRDNARPGSEPEIVPATGSCAYAGPHLGVSTVSCDATTAQGRFSARFHTDGRETGPEPIPRLHSRY